MKHLQLFEDFQLFENFLARASVLAAAFDGDLDKNPKLLNFLKNLKPKPVMIDLSTTAIEDLQLVSGKVPHFIDMKTPDVLHVFTDFDRATPVVKQHLIKAGVPVFDVASTEAADIMIPARGGDQFNEKLVVTLSSLVKR
jgi:hypothetical protein